jgi:hypothetical protein
MIFRQVSRMYWTLGLIGILSMMSCETPMVPQENSVDESLGQEKKLEPENALKFINAYVEKCNNHEDATSTTVWVNSTVWVTQEFKASLSEMMQKADPELGLGFDPIFNAQDYPSEGFEVDSIKPPHASTSEGFLILKGKNWTDFKLTIHMRYFNSQWLVDGCGVVNMPTDKQDKR